MNNEDILLIRLILLLTCIYVFMQLTIGLAFVNTSCYGLMFDLHSMFENKYVVTLTLVYLKTNEWFRCLH